MSSDKPQITIRPARPYDATSLCRLLTRAYDDTEDDVYPEVDGARMLTWVSTTLTDGYTVVAERGGRIYGSIALTNFQFPWSERWYMNMEWFYVDQTARKDGMAMGLLKHAHAYADGHRAPILGGVSSAKDTGLKDRLMSMQGYTYLGGQFLRKGLLDERPVQGREPDDAADSDDTGMGGVGRAASG